MKQKRSLVIALEMFYSLEKQYESTLLVIIKFLYTNNCCIIFKGRR